MSRFLDGMKAEVGPASNENWQISLDNGRVYVDWTKSLVCKLHLRESTTRSKTSDCEKSCESIGAETLSILSDCDFINSASFRRKKGSGKKKIELTRNENAELDHMIKNNVFPGHRWTGPEVRYPQGNGQEDSASGGVCCWKQEKVSEIRLSSTTEAKNSSQKTLRLRRNAK